MKIGSNDEDAVDKIKQEMGQSQNPNMTTVGTQACKNDQEENLIDLNDWHEESFQKELLDRERGASSLQERRASKTQGCSNRVMLSALRGRSSPCFMDPNPMFYQFPNFWTWNINIVCWLILHRFLTWPFRKLGSMPRKWRWFMVILQRNGKK